MATTINLGLVTVAGGTGNAITVTPSPAMSSYTDRLLVFFRATAGNSSTTPTLNYNGLGAKTIVKNGGYPLNSGDIPSLGSNMIVVFDLANNRWELLNPAKSVAGYTLAEVLGFANKTNQQSIDSDNGLSQAFIFDAFLSLTRVAANNDQSLLELNDTLAQLYRYDDSTGEEGSVTITDLLAALYHTLGISLNAPIVNLPNETASRYLYLDASKNIDTKTVAQVLSDIGAQPLDDDLTAIAALTGTNTIYYRSAADTWSAVTLGTSMQFLGGELYSLGRKIMGYQNTTASHTGDTNETILSNIGVTEDLVLANDVFWFESQVRKLGGVVGSATFRAYIGPNSNDLTGAVLIGTFSLVATNLSSGFRRRVVNKNAVNSNAVFPATVSAATDEATSTTAFTTTNIDFSVPQYHMITGQLTVITELLHLANVQTYNNKV